MYIIEKTSNINDNIPVMNHSRNVFHEAYEHKYERAHVLIRDDVYYDIYRIKNSDNQPDYVHMRWPGQTGIYEYEYYDENNIDSLYLNYLKHFDIVFIQEANEYTVVLAELIIKYTNALIYCLDNRIKWFISENEKLYYVKDYPKNIQCEVLNIGSLEKDKQIDLIKKDMGPVGAFHNVFFLQGTGIKDLSKYKYVEVILDNNAGIGSIINNLSRYKEAFAEFGLQLICRQNRIGHFPVDFLNKILNFDLQKDDANDLNTIYIKETAPFMITYFLVSHANPVIDSSILNEKFKKEMKEYSDALFKSKKMLGVLIRGTDYKLINNNNALRMASVDEMLPVIDDYINKYKFDAIFLATEDQDIFDQMKKIYGEKLYVVYQERHRISNMQGKSLLADLEKLEHKNEYENAIIESTTNYFYALYLLSQCNSFICSGICNGYHLVMAFNESHFEHVLYFKEGKDYCVQ